jgi:predicted secreted protein
MTKYAAYGTTFGVTGGTVIAQVKSVSGPGIKLDTVDVTTHDSTGGWEEVVGTILRSGEVKLELEYDPATATHKNAADGLIAIMIGKVAHSFTLSWPDAATTWVFNALVTGFEPSAPHDKDLSATVTLKVSGAPTIA